MCIKMLHATQKNYVIFFFELLHLVIAKEYLLFCYEAKNTMTQCAMQHMCIAHCSLRAHL
jgi:hypothetical protein